MTAASALVVRQILVGALPRHPAAVFDLAGEVGVLATMHGKARAVAPPLRRRLGVEIETLDEIDTDQFGTFTGEIERAGSQLDAARAKIAAAFAMRPGARVALASEGSFGPHPYIPFVPLGREIIVLQDRVTGLELIGRDATLGPRFDHQLVRCWEEALAFARRVEFPSQGVIVAASADGRRDPSRYLYKSATTFDDLKAAVRAVLKSGKQAHLECDMRADRNARRMRAIRRASVDLVRTYSSLCPSCARPGFVVSERLNGVPCAWCDCRTEEVRAEVRTCQGCGCRIETAIGPHTADPGRCGFCNP